MSYLEDKTISQSFLARADVCLQSAAFYAKYRDTRVQTHAMARGTAFHDFAEWYVGECLKTGEESLPPDVAREQMDAIVDERKDLTIPFSERDSLRAMAWNFAEGTRVDLENPPKTEIDAEMELNGWTIRGRIDWLVIVSVFDAYLKDYKTSLSAPSQEKFEQQFQLPLYALIVAEMDPRIDHFHMAEEYPRFLSKRCRACDTYNDGDAEICKECGEVEFDASTLMRRRVTISKRDLHDFKRNLISLLERIDHAVETDEWPASPGTHCNTCPAQRECPLPSPHLPFEITDQEQAVEVAQNLDRLQEIVGDVRESLKTFVSEQGTEIRYADKEWGFKTVISNKTDRKAMSRDQEKGELKEIDHYVTPSFSDRFDLRTIEQEVSP